MKVFGTGFGRTGTMSLKIALEKLGIGPCYHMQEIVSHPSHIKIWYNISRGASPNWNRLFKNFNSGVDFPISIFYEELVNEFPDAKFILTLRDLIHGIKVQQTQSIKSLPCCQAGLNG